ncbi:hypothetical protein [Streptomyces decoyicus]
MTPTAADAPRIPTAADAPCTRAAARAAPAAARRPADLFPDDDPR